MSSEPNQQNEEVAQSLLDIYCANNNPAVRVDCLRPVPDSEWNENNARDAMIINVEVFQFVPDRLKTQEMCQLAVNASGYLINYVPEQYFTNDMCIKIIKYGRIPEYMRFPRHLRTGAIWLESRTANVEALACLPLSEFTDDFCIQVAKQYYHAGHALKYLQRQPIEACAIILGRHPDMLMFLRDKTPELCLISITILPRALQYLSKEQQTDKLCKVAINKDPYSLRYVIDQSLELCELAFYKLKLSPPYGGYPTFLNFVKRMVDFIDLMSSITLQTREICLVGYQTFRVVFQGIRNDSHRRFVARHVSVDLVLALREAELSTHLLVNVLEQMESDLYPSLNFSGCPLSSTQLWSIVALANHASD
ncbi:MAG: hypothetical protein WC052_04520 [Patescibacteria group bacterium]